MADKKPKKTEVKKKPVVKKDNTKRDDLYLKIFVALCANPDSPKTIDELVSSAQQLTEGALQGMNKEQF